MKYKHAPNTAWREIDGKAFIVNTETSMLHEMDVIGTFIWKSCKKPATIASIADAIHENYAVELSQAQIDAENFIKSLVKAGIAQQEQ